MNNVPEPYTLQEMGEFIHLLHKRSTHRIDPAMAHEDLQEARRYLEMIDEHLRVAELKAKEAMSPQVNMFEGEF